jgi:hypothetical protein
MGYVKIKKNFMEENSEDNTVMEVILLTSVVLLKNLLLNLMGIPTVNIINLINHPGHKQPL